jgi:hypothetical protein
LSLVTGPSSTPDAAPPTPAAPSPSDDLAAAPAEPRPDPTERSALAARPPAAPESGPRHAGGAINPGPVEYKGAPLDAERGPGLGCFRFQLIVLAVLIVATPLSVGRVPDAVTAILLFATIGLLLVSGQTIIFLLRLVAADRRGRRRPLGSATPTVGQLEDAASEGAGPGQPAAADLPESRTPPGDAGADPPAVGPVRQ